MLAYIRKHDLMRPGDRVGVAVSGGADSVALLRLMLELRDELGVVLSVVHLNHKLRGAESDADERFVRELGRTHGLEIVAESSDVKAYAAEKKLSLEAGARAVRYALFERLLKDRDLDQIATAHTLDDQAETVLLKLMRGAGTRGLAGIYPERAVSHQPSAASQKPNTAQARDPAVVRPLLGTRQGSLRSYLEEVGQSWREDVSNQDLRHTRNRIRQEILPRLERQVNPAVCETLAEAADIARAEEAYWAQEVDRFLPEVWTRDERGGVLHLRPFAPLALAVRRRLVRAAAESLGIALEFRHVEEILGQACQGGASALSGQWMIARHGDELRFEKAGQPFSDYQYDLSVPGKIAVPEAGIEVETLAVNGNSQAHRYSAEHLLDLRFAQKPWVVRNWRAGERFWPAHSKQPKKIKDLLQDKHITGDQKRRWPVIACGDEIIWAMGFGVRRDFQANGSEGVLIREVREEAEVRRQNAEVRSKK